MRLPCLLTAICAGRCDCGAVGVLPPGHSEAGLLHRVHIVIFGSVGVLYDELAAESGHETRSRVTASQGPAFG